MDCGRKTSTLRGMKRMGRNEMTKYMDFGVRTSPVPPRGTPVELLSLWPPCRVGNLLGPLRQVIWRGPWSQNDFDTRTLFCFFISGIFNSLRLCIPILSHNFPIF